MEPLDDRSKDLVVDLLLLACAKVALARPGAHNARPGTRDALRATEATFTPLGEVDLAAAWGVLQQVGGVAVEDATEACSFVKTLETRLGVAILVPPEATTRPREQLIGDAEIERFFTAAAIRPQAAGKRTFPGILSHSIGRAIAPTRTSGRVPADTGSTPAIAASDQAALSKLDALYATGEQDALAAAPTRTTGGQARLTGSARAVSRASGRVPAIGATPGQQATKLRRQRILAIGLSVLAVILALVFAVPSLRDGSVPPQVLEPAVVAPLKVRGLRVLGPDAEAILADEVTWLSAPLAQRQAELEAALQSLQPYRVVRLTILANDRAVASVQSSGGRIVVRFGR